MDCEEHAFEPLQWKFHKVAIQKDILHFPRFIFVGSEL